MKRIYLFVSVVLVALFTFSACVDAPRWRLGNDKENGPFSATTTYEGVGSACIGREGSIDWLKISWERVDFFHSTIISSHVICKGGVWRHRHNSTKSVSWHVLTMIAAIVAMLLSLYVYVGNHARSSYSTAAAHALMAFVFVGVSNLLVLFSSYLSLLALGATLFAGFAVLLREDNAYRFFVVLFAVASIAFLATG